MGNAYPPLGSISKLDKESLSIFEAHVLPVLNEYVSSLNAAGYKTDIVDGLDSTGPGFNESLVVSFGFGKASAHDNRLLVCLQRNSKVFQVYIARGEQEPRKRGYFDRVTAGNFREMVKSTVESHDTGVNSKNT